MKRLANVLLLVLLVNVMSLPALAAQEAVKPAPAPLPTYLPAEEIDKIKAVAEKGDTKAQYRLSQIYGEGKEAPMNMPEALKWAQKSADLGNEYAQIMVGTLYGIGLGAPADVSKTEKWIRKAAQKGNPLAEGGMGYLYGEGIGVKQDYNESFKWLEKSANKGNPVGLAGLGKIYSDGLGKPKDPIRGYMFYELSIAAAKEAKGVKAKGDWEDVMPLLYKRGMLVEQVSSFRDQAGKTMSQSQIDKAKKLASDWQKKKK